MLVRIILHSAQLCAVFVNVGWSVDSLKWISVSRRVFWVNFLHWRHKSVVKSPNSNIPSRCMVLRILSTKGLVAGRPPTSPALLETLMTGKLRYSRTTLSDKEQEAKFLTTSRGKPRERLQVGSRRGGVLSRLLPIAGGYFTI